MASTTASQKEEILKYYGSGLSPQEIATTIGGAMKSHYVSQVFRRHEGEDRSQEVKDGTVTSPNVRTLGSEMAVLDEVIRESTTSKKVNAIVRAFDQQMPDDYTSLARLCSRARIPLADIAFIIDNWAKHRGNDLSPDDVNEILENAKLRAKAAQKAAQEKVEVKSIADIEKDEAEHLAKRINSLRQRQLLNDLRSDLGAGGQQRAPPPMSKRITKHPQMDDDGNLKYDSAGGVVYDVVEEEGPATAMTTAQSGGMGDVLPLMMQQNSQSSNLIATLMAALVDKNNQPAQVQTDDSRKDDMLMKIMDMQRDKDLEGMKASHDRQLEELKGMMREKDLEERYMGQMAALQDDLKNMQGQSLSDDRFRLQLQSQLTGRLIDEVSQAKDTLGGGIASFLKESVEDRRHLRHLEQMRAAQQMGLDPSSFKKQWEEERVPSVSDDEFDMIMSGG